MPNMEDSKALAPEKDPVGSGPRAPRFGTGSALLFAAFALLPAAFAAAVGEYSFGLLLLPLAAGLSALSFFCGGIHAGIAALPWLFSAGISLFLRPERPWFALFILAFALLAGAVAFGGKRGFSRTRLTAVGAGALALCLAIGFLLYLFLRFGGVGRQSLSAFRESCVRNFTATVQAVNDSYRASLLELGSESALELLEMIPSDAQVAQTVEDAAEVLSGLLPGILLALSCCAAHFTSFLFCRFGRYYRRFAFASPEESSVCIALPGAILFYLGAIFTVFGGNGVVSLSFTNFFLIYLPGFVLMGAREVFPGKKRRAGRGAGGFLLPLLLGMSFFLNPLLLPLFLAILGASASVRAAILRRMAQKGSKDGGQDR